MSTHFFDPAPAACLSLEPPAARERAHQCSRGRLSSAPTAGFTLIELLVSMTVTLLLVVALMQIFNAATNTWRHGEAQVDAYREARGALQFMARDLSATLQASYAQPAGTTATTYSPPLPTLALQRSPSTPAADGGPINEEVYCLTNIPNSGAISGMSSLCAVGYYCQWMPDIRPPIANCPQAYALMRQSLDSNGTFLCIKNATTSPLGFNDLFARATASVTQLAVYIWDLRFRIDTNLNDQLAATRDGNDPSPKDHTSPTARTYQATAPPYPPHLPPYVEIRFKALSNIAGRRLEGNAAITKSTWMDTDQPFTPTAAYRTIIQPNAQQFVLRVPFLNATLSPAATPTPSP